MLVLFFFFIYNVNVTYIFNTSFQKLHDKLDRFYHSTVSRISLSRIFLASPLMIYIFRF